MSHRADQIDACRVVNQLWWDILGADGILQVLEERRVRFHSEDVLGAVQRVVVFSLVLSLTKVVECYERYQRVLPIDVRKRLRELRNELMGRPLWKLRSQVVAHLLEKDSRRPLGPAEVNRLVNEVIGGDSEAFFAWVRNSGQPDDLATVFGILHWSVRRMRHDFTLTEEETGLSQGLHDNGPLPAEE